MLSARRWRKNMALTLETCEMYPDTRISVGLFENVTNCKEIHEKSKNGDIKVALINPEMV